jgi:threonine dehydratase
VIAGWRCAVCGESVEIATPFAWRCPNATADDPYHVLHLVDTPGDAAPLEGRVADINPMMHYGPSFAWWAFARANGMTAGACEALTLEVAGDFRVTPFRLSERLSAELGTNVWVKDETGGVAGSHKARHLAGILLHLRAAEALGMLTERPPLAIASCGNAALAAATLAARVGWPIDVYVPTWMDAAFGRRLDELGARITRCQRRADDPPGDPAMIRFREARDAGAIPFTVQGPENGACLDTGRTIGWELAGQAASAGVELSRVFAQTGGGAFGACLGAGLGRGVRLDMVQAEGCAPLADAWGRMAGIDQPERYWAQIMRPWPAPQSVADGILDDETYDWIADIEAMVESGGEPVVAAESDIVRAHELAVAAGFDVSPTGSAGLAGLLAVIDQIGRADHVAVVMTGVSRD